MQNILIEIGLWSEWKGLILSNLNIKKSLLYSLEIRISYFQIWLNSILPFSECKYIQSDNFILYDY